MRRLNQLLWCWVRGTEKVNPLLCRVQIQMVAHSNELASDGCVIDAPSSNVKRIFCDVAMIDSRIRCSIEHIATHGCAIDGCLQRVESRKFGLLDIDMHNALACCQKGVVANDGKVVE